MQFVTKKNVIIFALILTILFCSFSAASLALASSKNTIYTFFGLPWNTTPSQLPDRITKIADIVVEPDSLGWFEMVGSTSFWGIDCNYVSFVYHDNQELSSVMLSFIKDDLPENKSSILTASEFDINKSWDTFIHLFESCQKEYGKPTAFVVSLRPKMESSDDLLRKTNLTLDMAVNEELCKILKQLALTNYSTSLNIYFSNIKLSFDLTWGQNNSFDDEGSFFAQCEPSLVYSNQVYNPKCVSTLSNYLSANIVEKSLMRGLDKYDFISICNARLQELNIVPPSVASVQDNAFNYGKIRVQFDSNNLISSLAGPWKNDGDLYTLLAVVSALEFPLDKTTNVFDKTVDLITDHFEKDEYTFYSSHYFYAFIDDAFMILPN